MKGHIMSKYKTVGAGWNKENGSISLKIEGADINLTLWPNDYKKVDKHPDWTISVKTEVAKEYGFGKDKPIQKNDAINPEDIPF